MLHAHLQGLNRSLGESLHPGDDEMRRLYVEERLSCAAIGRLYGVHKKTTSRWLRKTGIAARETSEATKLGMDTPELKQRMSEAKRGSRHPNWRGGSPYGPHPHLRTTAWRKRSLESRSRDKFTCQECGTQSRRLQAHHIVSRRSGGGDDLDNLITLCAVCHTRAERA